MIRSKQWAVHTGIKESEMEEKKMIQEPILGVTLIKQIESR